MSKLFVIGAFGFKSNKVDGQTIKTRSVYEALSKKYQVSFLDTQELKSNKLLVLKLIFALLKYSNIYYLGAQGSLRFLFPIIFLLSKLRGSRLVYVTIGGWLYDFLLNNNRIYKYFISNIRFVLVETNFLKNSLKSMGIKNVSIIPNFRVTTETMKSNTYLNLNQDNLKLVFMARVMREKGIYLIFDLVEDYMTQATLYGKKISVDFYGPIEDKDKSRFNFLIDKFNSIVSYKGVLEPKSIYNTLCNYDVLLLPTFYTGEGFPGTILDAYLCGLPVIATNWKQIPEFVEPGLTGFLIDYNINDLTEKIKLISKDEELLLNLKRNALLKSKEYSWQMGLEILESAMGLNESPLIC